MGLRLLRAKITTTITMRITTTAIMAINVELLKVEDETLTLAL